MKDLLRWLLVRYKNNNSKISTKAKVSLNTKLSEKTVIGEGAKLGDCSVGRYTYIGKDCTFERTTIGAFCSVGPEVMCGLGSHPSHFISTYPGFYTQSSSGAFFLGTEIEFIDKDQVNIGNDVWIGARVIIKGGITINDGAIIAAGSVVTKDVDAYSIVGGVPAKMIKYRFSEDEIIELKKINWWDKDENWLRKNMVNIDNIENFLKNIENE